MTGHLVAGALRAQVTCRHGPIPGEAHNVAIDVPSIRSRVPAHARRARQDPRQGGHLRLRAQDRARHAARRRLYPDMFPLARQVQIATDHAKGASARLAGVAVPSFEDNEKTIRRAQGAHRQDARLRRHASSPHRSTARKGATSRSRPARASSPSRARITSCSSPCRTSISTPRRPSTSCATTASPIGKLDFLNAA